MTMRESHALLKEMRETGCVPMFKSKLGTKVHAKLRGKFVNFVGFGAWACKNTFFDFYIFVQDYTLVERKPSDHYEWGL